MKKFNFTDGEWNIGDWYEDEYMIRKDIESDDQILAVTTCELDFNHTDQEKKTQDANIKLMSCSKKMLKKLIEIYEKSILSEDAADFNLFIIEDEELKQIIEESSGKTWEEIIE